jgi:hypothetical protein
VSDGALAREILALPVQPVQSFYTTPIVANAKSADTCGSEARALFRSSRRRLIVHLLSLALLIAQLGMEAHASSHFKPHSDGLPGQTIQLCGQCASSAPLLSMTSSSCCIRVPFAPDSAGIAPASIGANVGPLPHPPFRSRAPPRLF